MQSKNALGNLKNRYAAVLKKCNLLNVFGSLAIVGSLTASLSLGANMLMPENAQAEYINSSPITHGIETGATGINDPIITNKSTITVVGNGTSIGIYANSGPDTYSFTNATDAKIDITSTNADARGMDISNGTIVNHGTINVNGDRDAYGIFSNTIGTTTLSNTGYINSTASNGDYAEVYVDNDLTIVTEYATSLRDYKKHGYVFENHSILEFDNTAFTARPGYGQGFVLGQEYYVRDMINNPTNTGTVTGKIGSVTTDSSLLRATLTGTDASNQSIALHAIINENTDISLQQSLNQLNTLLNNNNRLGLQQFLNNNGDLFDELSGILSLSDLLKLKQDIQKLIDNTPYLQELIASLDLEEELKQEELKQEELWLQERQQREQERQRKEQGIGHKIGQKEEQERQRKEQEIGQEIGQKIGQKNEQSMEQRMEEIGQEQKTITQDKQLIKNYTEIVLSMNTLYKGLDEFTVTLKEFSASAIFSSALTGPAALKANPHFIEKQNELKTAITNFETTYKALPPEAKNIPSYKQLGEEIASLKTYINNFNIKNTAEANEAHGKFFNGTGANSGSPMNSGANSGSVTNTQDIAISDFVDNFVEKYSSFVAGATLDTGLASAQSPKWSVNVSPYGSANNADTSNGSSFGLSGGVSRIFNEKFTAGVHFDVNYSSSNADMYDTDSDVWTTSFGVNANYNINENWYVGGQITMAFSQTESDYETGAFTRYQANDEYGGYSFTTAINTGYLYKINENNVISPEIGLSYVYQHTDKNDIKWNNNGDYMNVYNDANDYSALYGTLNLRWIGQYNLENQSILKPFVSVGIRQNLTANKMESSMTFFDTRFITESTPDLTTFITSAGLEWTHDKFTVSANYNGAFGSDNQNHGGSLSFSYKF